MNAARAIDRPGGSKGNGVARGSVRRTPWSPLCLLSWRNKKVGPPAGVCLQLRSVQFFAFVACHFTKEKVSTVGADLCFPYKLFPALGAGDGDLTLATGDTHLLTAAGAVEVTMVFVFDFLQEHQVFPVFLIPLIGISGKGPKNSPAHQSVRQQCKTYIKKGVFDKQYRYTQRNTYT